MEEDQPNRSKLIWAMIIILVIAVVIVGTWWVVRWYQTNHQPIAEDSYIGSLLNPPKTVHKAEDTQVKADIAQIQSMLEIYRSENRSYPKALTNPEPIGRILSIIENRSGATVSSGDLLYATDTSGDYYIFTKLSNKSDPSIQISSPPGISMPEGYNYWVTR